MGYIKHHAIIVTSWDSSRLTRAHEKAKELDMLVSETVGPGVNGYMSFFIAPDGSKEGWSDSDDGDARRDAFLEFLIADTDHYCEWCEVAYGSDDSAAKVTNHAWQRA